MTRGTEAIGESERFADSFAFIRFIFVFLRKN